MNPIVYTSMYNKLTGIVKRLEIKACDLHDVNIYMYIFQGSYFLALDLDMIVVIMFDE